MKTHFVIGFLIGAAINLVFQYTDTAPHLDLLELATCATVAALAAVTTARLQRPAAVLHCRRTRPVATVDRSH